MRNRPPRRPIILPVRLSRDEYQALADLARLDDRSRCAMLRRLVTEAQRRLADETAGGHEIAKLNAEHRA